MKLSIKPTKHRTDIPHNRYGAGNVGVIIGLICLCAGALFGGWWLLQPPQQVKNNPPSNNITVTPSSPTLTIYCAAGIQPVMDKIVKAYLKDQKIEVECHYGGSGTLLDSLQSAKRGDLYLAADSSYIDIAKNKKLVRESFPIARIWPVIAVKKGNPKNIKGIADLLRDDVSFELANPKAASIGKLTKQLLIQSGDWKKVSEKVKTFKPTVTETAADVLLGAVNAAVLWNTTVVVHQKKMDMVQVPHFQKAIKNVTVGVLSFSDRPTETLKFARYMQSPTKGQKEFAKMGYETIVGDQWAERPKLIFYSGGVNRLAIEQTLKQFEIREGIELQTSYNGCGILVSLIKGNQEQPPDVYFACDVSFMTQVQQRFKPAKNIAETDMVLIVAKGNPKEINSIDDLTLAGLQVGVANPKLSALGSLTKRLCEKVSVGESDLYTAMKPNIVTLQPTADFLVNQLLTGALDAAIVYRANVAVAKSKLEVIDIKQGNPTATQPIAIYKESKYPYLSQRLVDALSSNQSEEQFLIHGFNWRVTK